ncbi:hypothetical protein L1049_019470 [Liquidambar formosana]|uniref:Thioesterase domain-containing protein n=1 Tax=Liquidambar formosana TaxID=63359 RepID=A0AAP0S6P4_LIQFO
MDLESVKRYLEKGGSENESSFIDSMPPKFFETLITQGLHVDLIQPGRVICTMKVPPRLLNADNVFHGGATAMLVDLVGTTAIYSLGGSVTGVSVEINISYMDAAYADEEIEIEAKALHVGKVVAVISVELRKKKTGKIIAQGRHSKYLYVPSKM